MSLEDFYIWIFKLWVDLEMLEELERTVGGSGKCRKDWRQNLKKGKSLCLGPSCLWVLGYLCPVDPLGTIPSI